MYAASSRRILKSSGGQQCQFTADALMLDELSQVGKSALARSSHRQSTAALTQLRY